MKLDINSLINERAKGPWSGDGRFISYSGREIVRQRLCFTVAYHAVGVDSDGRRDFFKKAKEAWV